jgi:hypothetical protein
MAPYAIQIPESAYSGIVALASLSDDSFRELVQALTETKPTFYPAEFGVRVASKVGIDANVVDEIVRFILPLYSLRSDMEVTIPQFVDIFLEAAEEIPSDVLEIEETKDVLAQRLPRLLELEQSIGVISKAQFIANEHNRLLTTSRIYTELRPIFKENPEELLVAGVILHKLKIAYIEGNDTKEFFVTLDANDLENLRKALDRAEKKAQSLRTLLSSTPMAILEVTSDE